MKSTDVLVRAEAEALQMRYCHALDSKSMNAWIDCFSEKDEASYICISKENDDHALAIALILDDSRGRIEDRATYIDRIWAGTFQDYTTRHFTQTTKVESIDSGLISLRSNFQVLYTTEDTGSTGVLAAGEYKDIIDPNDGEARFLSKRAVLDTTVLPRYLVYPL